MIQSCGPIEEGHLRTDDKNSAIDHDCVLTCGVKPVIIRFFISRIIPRDEMTAVNAED